jgi:hypothetical protein
MYKALWNKIPLPTFLKVLIALVIVLGFSLFCFTVFFPWVVQYIPYPLGNYGYVEGTV